MYYVCPTGPAVPAPPLHRCAGPDQKLWTDNYRRHRQAVTQVKCSVDQKVPRTFDGSKNKMMQQARKYAQQETRRVLGKSNKRIIDRILEIRRGEGYVPPQGKKPKPYIPSIAQNSASVPGIPSLKAIGDSVDDLDLMNNNQNNVSQMSDADNDNMDPMSPSGQGQGPQLSPKGSHSKSQQSASLITVEAKKEIHAAARKERTRVIYLENEALARRLVSVKTSADIRREVHEKHYQLTRTYIKSGFYRVKPKMLTPLPHIKLPAICDERVPSPRLGPDHVSRSKKELEREKKLAESQSEGEGSPKDSARGSPKKDSARGSPKSSPKESPRYEKQSDTSPFLKHLKADQLKKYQNDINRIASGVAPNINQQQGKGDAQGSPRSPASVGVIQGGETGNELVPIDAGINCLSPDPNSMQRGRNAKTQSEDRKRFNKHHKRSSGGSDKNVWRPAANPCGAGFLNPQWRISAAEVKKSKKDKYQQQQLQSGNIVYPDDILGPSKVKTPNSGIPTKPPALENAKVHTEGLMTPIDQWGEPAPVTGFNKKTNQNQNLSKGKTVAAGSAAGGPGPSSHKSQSTSSKTQSNSSPKTSKGRGGASSKDLTDTSTVGGTGGIGPKSSRTGSKSSSGSDSKTAPAAGPVPGPSAVNSNQNLLIRQSLKDVYVGVFKQIGKVIGTTAAEDVTSSTVTNTNEKDPGPSDDSYNERSVSLSLSGELDIQRAASIAAGLEDLDVSTTNNVTGEEKSQSKDEVPKSENITEPVPVPGTEAGSAVTSKSQCAPDAENTDQIEDTTVVTDAAQVTNEHDDSTLVKEEVTANEDIPQQVESQEKPDAAEAVEAQEPDQSEPKNENGAEDPVIESEQQTAGNDNKDTTELEAQADKAASGPEVNVVEAEGVQDDAPIDEVNRTDDQEASAVPDTDVNDKSEEAQPVTDNVEDAAAAAVETAQADTEGNEADNTMAQVATGEISETKEEGLQVPATESITEEAAATDDPANNAVSSESPEPGPVEETVPETVVPTEEVAQPDVSDATVPQVVQDAETDAVQQTSDEISPPVQDQVQESTEATVQPVTNDDSAPVTEEQAQDAAEVQEPVTVPEDSAEADTAKAPVEESENAPANLNTEVSNDGPEPVTTQTVTAESKDGPSGNSDDNVDQVNNGDTTEPIIPESDDPIAVPESSNKEDQGTVENVEPEEPGPQAEVTEANPDPVSEDVVPDAAEIQNEENKDADAKEEQKMPMSIEEANAMAILQQSLSLEDFEGGGDLAAALLGVTAEGAAAEGETPAASPGSVEEESKEG